MLNNPKMIQLFDSRLILFLKSLVNTHLKVKVRM